MHATKGKFTTPENLHLTLAFLGEVDPEDLPALSIVLDAVDAVAFDLTLSGLFGFNRGRDGILCLHADGGSALSELAVKVRSALASEGFSFDPKPFLPHLTIARMCDASEPGVQAAQTLPVIRTRVEGFTLMASVRENGALVYRPLHETPCGSANP